MPGLIAVAPCSAPQVVHHLFPGVCHTHYPAIAPIVMATCQEFKVPYQVYPTVRPGPLLLLLLLLLLLQNPII